MGCLIFGASPVGGGSEGAAIARSSGFVITGSFCFSVAEGKMAGEEENKGFGVVWVVLDCGNATLSGWGDADVLC